MYDELTEVDIKKMREEIDSNAQQHLPKMLILDFGEVDFMDSSGIGLVLGRYRMMQELGGELCLQDMPAHIRKVMRVAGIDNLRMTQKGGKKG